MLHRVVAEVFGEQFERDWSPDPKVARFHQVRLSTAERSVGLRATYEWCDITFLDLGFGTTAFDHDHDVEPKEDELRQLALLGLAYLRGEGRVTQERGWFRTRPVLRLEVDGHPHSFGRGLLGWTWSRG
ncbi:hypothetical protein GCM10027596_04810 [Nocardioides korecus]